MYRDSLERIILSKIASNHEEGARTHAGEDIMAPFFPSSAGQALPRLRMAYVM